MRKIDIEKIIANNGATLDKSGAWVNFSAGYQVSKKDCYILNAANVNKILSAVNKLLNSIHAGEFVGLWVDGGKMYIDISERVPRLADAIKIGVERKQKSIFDWCMSRCIGLEV